MGIKRPMWPFTRATMAAGGSSTPPMEAPMAWVGEEMRPIFHSPQILISLTEVVRVLNYKHEKKGCGLMIIWVPPFFVFPLNKIYKLCDLAERYTKNWNTRSILRFILGNL